MADNKQQESDTGDNKEMEDNREQDLDKMDNKGQLLASVDIPWASYQLEASYRMVTSLDTLDMDDVA